MAQAFNSSAATLKEWWGDLSDWYLSKRRKEGTVTPSTGVTKPLPSGDDWSIDKVINTVKGWNMDQKNRRGGFAYDKSGAPVDETYRQRRYEFIAASEGSRLAAYDDATGKPVTSGKVDGLVTVGVGFNMDRPDARDVWKRATGLDDKAFDEVYKGKRRITEDQARKLFDYTVNEAESFVHNRFKGVDLPEHQRLALVSLAFNNPSLIGPNLTRFVKEGDVKSARDEILHRSNAKGIRGLATRRYHEAAMFVGGAEAKLALPDYKDYMRNFS